MSAQAEIDDIRRPDTAEFTSLVAELKLLARSGPRAVGSCRNLMAAYGLPADVSPEVAWSTVESRLKSAATHLDPRLRLALIEGMGLRPGSPRDFGERLQLIGTHQDRSGRTARRRVYEALEAVARLTLSGKAKSLVPTPDWLMVQASVHADLRGKAPSVVMTRTILALAPEVGLFEEKISVPRLAPSEAVRVLALDGCRSVEVEAQANATFGISTQLSRSIPYGAEHTFTISIQLPRHEAMTPMVGFYPLNPTREIRASVTFGSTRPTSVARFEGDIPVGTFLPVTQELDPGLRRHECVFRDAQVGRGYGVSWKWD